MTTGLVLIAAILVLGGVIATVGDRLGMKVGKARLSLFGLRPRQTATLITILTGTLISASTFGILFAIDDQLRRGVFDYQEIQAEKRAAEEQRDLAVEEREQAEQERESAQQEQTEAKRELQNINQSLKGAIAQRDQIESQLDRTEDQLGTTQQQLADVESRFAQAENLLRSVSQQSTQLRREIQQLEAVRQQEISERDQSIAERDRALQERNRAIAEREQQLQQLEVQRTQLEQEVQTLEREFQGLRQGNVALTRNQPLASGVVRIVAPEAVPQAIDRLLQEANRTAAQRIRPGSRNADKQVIRITREQVEALINQLEEGGDFVLRILAAGNYVVGEPCVLAGEPCVQVYGTANRNQVIFEAGEVITSTSIDPSAMNDSRVFERINLLLAAAQFRARQAGIIADRIQLSTNQEAVEDFFANLQQANQPLDIRAIARTRTYTAGPLEVELLAIQDGQVVFSTLSEADSGQNQEEP